jgi:hypothetical protein
VYIVEVDKPFIHAKVAKETANAIHIKIKLVITEAGPFLVLLGSIT